MTICYFRLMLSSIYLAHMLTDKTYQSKCITTTNQVWRRLEHIYYVYGYISMGEGVGNERKGNIQKAAVIISLIRCLCMFQSLIEA